MMKNKFMVTVISKKDGSTSTYSGIDRISPSHDGNAMFLIKDLTDKEMKLYDRDPNEQEDYISVCVENIRECTILITMI